MMPQAGRVSAREALLVLVLGVVLAAYFTWPMALRPASVGRLEFGDGMFSVWNVAWVAHALTTPDADLFDANIFYPHSNTLAYSEPNIGAGLLAVPAWALTRNPYAAHNSAVLIALLFSVLGMYLLVRHLTGSREAAAVAAILFTFCPFFFARTAHIQLMMTAPLPFALLAFHRFAERTTVPRAVVLGIAIAVQALFCAYYGVLAGLLVGLGVLVFAFQQRRWRQPRWWLLAIGAAVVAGLLVLPVLMPVLELQAETGFERPLAEASLYAADWRAYLASSAYAHRWMLPYLGSWKEVLFPGFTALILGIAGMVLAGKRARHRVAARPGPAVMLFYALILVVALWSSFGPAAGLYSVLYHTVPVFSLLRAPARFGIAVTLALSVFAATTIAWLLAGRSRSQRGWLTAALAVAAIAELSTSIPYLPARDVPPAYRLLASARRGSVAEFPFYDRPEDRFRHTLYMLGSTWHWQPLVNGYSDFMPEDFIQGASLVRSFPNPEAFRWLQARRVRYVVFHLGLYDTRSRERLLARLAEHADYLAPRHVDGAVHLYEIVNWPAGP